MNAVNLLRRYYRLSYQRETAIDAGFGGRCGRLRAAKFADVLMADPGGRV